MYSTEVVLNIFSFLPLLEFVVGHFPELSMAGRKEEHRPFFQKEKISIKFPSYWSILDDK